jgi:hypothetical protein
MTAIIRADVRADFENVYRALEKAHAEHSDDWKDGEEGTAVKEWLDTQSNDRLGALRWTFDIPGRPHWNH